MQETYVLCLDVIPEIRIVLVEEWGVGKEQNVVLRYICKDRWGIWKKH